MISCQRLLWRSLFFQWSTEGEASCKSALEGAPGYCGGESGGASHLPRWRLIRHSYTSSSSCSFLCFVRAVSSAEKNTPCPELCNWSHSSSSYNIQHKCHLHCEVLACPSRLSLCAPCTSLFMSPLLHLSQPDIPVGGVQVLSLSPAQQALRRQGLSLPSEHTQCCVQWQKHRLNPKHVGGAGDIA